MRANTAEALACVLWPAGVEARRAEAWGAEGVAQSVGGSWGGAVEDGGAKGERHQAREEKGFCREILEEAVFFFLDV